MTLRSAALAIAGLVVLAHVARAQSGALSAPGEVAAGSSFEVKWSGPAAQGDFISVDRPGDAERTYGSSYGYPATANPLKLTAPNEPGEYLIRFHRVGDYTVLGSAPLRITAVTAKLEGPASVAAGAELSVRWTGPDNPNDFVSIDRAGAADRDYGPYAYPRSGNPLKLRAPDEAGDYELRYHQAGSYTVIGRAPLRVGAVDASLAAAEAIAAGGAIEVRWVGPAGPHDFISIDAPGADERSYGAYAYPSSGNPLRVRAPDEPGEYLLRYHTGQTYKVLATRAIRVEPVTAQLTAPAEVVAGRVFELAWKGPDNEGDFITLVPAAAPPQEHGTNNAYPKRGNPLRIEAARKPGDYELRYLTGQTGRLLGRSALKITPDATPGRLKVVAAGGAAGATSFAAVELVLDASGSMLARLAGQRRIDLAKRALADVTHELAPGTGFALRVFGHKEADSCRTDLEMPLAPLDAAAALARIGAVEPQNLAKTPIGASLARVRDDLAGATGPALVVLVTDGEETCEGDPKAAIEALRSAGLDVRVNIVGFAIDEVGLKETFQSWARAGNGAYFDAQDGAQLGAAVRSAVRVAFEVLDGERVVATGMVSGEPVELPPGTYRVRVVGATGRETNGVVIEPGAARDLTL
jgi:hypothetical protein